MNQIVIDLLTFWQQSVELQQQRGNEMNADTTILLQKGNLLSNEQRD